MPTFPFKLITESGTLFSREVTSVVAPGVEGQVGILAHHAPMVCATRRGWMKIALGDGPEKFFLVHEGVLEVRSDQVVLLADYAEPAASADAATAALKHE